MSNSGGWSQIGVPVLVAFVLFSIVGGTASIMALVCLFGHVEVRVRGPRGVVFTGVGPYGWRREFDATAVTGVRLDVVDSADAEREAIHAIRLDADRRIRFAVFADKRRRDWLAGALMATLVPGASRPTPRPKVVADEDA